MMATATCPAEPPMPSQQTVGKRSVTIFELVAEARRLTGKPATAKDTQLVEFLQEQEIDSADDFFGLSDASFQSIIEHSSVTLMLADALRQLRATSVKSDDLVKRVRSSDKTEVSAPEMASMPLCKVTINEFIGTVTMTHNRKRNALGAQLCSEIASGLERCVAAGVRVLILRAMPGVSVWSAGHDMREFHRSNGTTAQAGTGSFSDPLSRNDPFVQLLQEIRSCPVPVIAAVEGGVWGGACDIVACCDVAIGTPDTTFAITPAKVGLPYHASGMTHFLGVLPLHVVKWMFFSSKPLTAEEATRYGFLNICVPADELTAKATEMANEIAARAPLVVELLKKNLNTLSQAATLSPEQFEDLHEMRKRAWLSRDMEEGVSAFFEKRPPTFSRC